MADWVDLFSLIMTITVIGGAIYAIIFISKQITNGVKYTQESLKNKGLIISDKGVSVKTSKRFDRADYVDATQRGFVKAFGAASFGKADNGSGSSTPPAKMQRQDSSASTKSNSSSEEKKRQGMFRRGPKVSKE